MKKTLVGILAAALIATGGIFAFGQKSGEIGRHGHGPGGFPGFLLGRIADEIGLSDEQKSQIRGILEESKTRIEPLMASAKATHEELAALGKDGKFDEARVNQLAGQQAETAKQLIIEKEKTKAQVFGVLTAEQKAKAEELKGKMKERFKGRGGMPFGGAKGFGPVGF